MIVDCTAQTDALVWGIIIASLMLGLALFVSFEPELAEVYLGNVQLLLVTLALIAIAVAMLSAGIATASKQPEEFSELHLERCTRRAAAPWAILRSCGSRAGAQLWRATE